MAKKSRHITPYVCEECGCYLAGTVLTPPDDGLCDDCDSGFDYVEEEDGVHDDGIEDDDDEYYDGDEDDDDPNDDDDSEEEE